MTVGKAVDAILGAFLLLTISLGGIGQARAQTSPQEAAKFVLALGSEAVLLQSAVRSEPLEKRAAVLQGLVRRGFNLELISQFVLGRFWHRATAEQRAEFQELFTEYLVNSYARQLGSYRAETLNIVASRPVGSQDVLVETSVEGSDGAANPIWRVRAEAGAYKIIDVSIEGVSLALTQRREFAAVINRQGLDGLLDMLREKLAAQAKAAHNAPVKGKLKISLFASILASPNANKIGFLLARR
ncbi:MAG: ABC transporter substrate-binding protein [Proteobacteria bacterium]|nr:ABC transporter substrate-binding protein [Pseudomonadota bacterium]